MQVLDYSAGFPGAAAIKAAGYGGAVRYIGFPDRRKCTSKAELEDFTRHGIGMALVYEDHADDWRSGYSGGVAAARRARAHADAIGFPRERPIYMAVDRDVVTEPEFRAAMDYLRGAGSVLGREWTGVYGEHDVCARAASEPVGESRGVARWFWQCRAWSGTPPRMFGGRHLYQYAGYVYVSGITCDYNDVLRDDWGQHTLEGDVSAQEVWDHRVPRTPDPVDKRTDAAAWELLRYTNEMTREVRDVVLKVFAMVTSDPDITEERLRALWDEQTTRQAKLVIEGVNAGIAQKVEDALGRVQDADNLEEAKETALAFRDELARLLAAHAPAAAQEVNA
ncbi:glycoside hydrolase domain-containing protein [Saccharothrix xinjiangensis]|uniref:Glycoside hydrolase domain-containing protein n=1 Tax=Saccharothrix xinjiangensis TaxID=204798 RepID=A0ABV9XTC8_9PSEU